MIILENHDLVCQDEQCNNVYCLVFVSIYLSTTVFSRMTLVFFFSFY